jgi:hypothetical protein
VVDAMEVDVLAGKCLLCAGPIAGIHRVGHWSEHGGGSGFWFTGSCKICDVDFRLSARNGVFGKWRLELPDGDYPVVLFDHELLHRPECAGGPFADSFGALLDMAEASMLSCDQPGAGHGLTNG